MEVWVHSLRIKYFKWEDMEAADQIMSAVRKWGHEFPCSTLLALDGAAHIQGRLPPFR